MSSKEAQKEKERGSTVKGSSGTRRDDSLGKRSKSTGGMKGDKSEKAEPGTTEPSPLERKSSSKKKRSFFKRSRSSSGTRSSSKAVVNGGGGDDDDDGGGADSEVRGGDGAEGAGAAGLGGHRAVVSDDEGSVQVSRPRDRLRRMTVKEARMEKRVKWMSSANALPSRSQRRRRAMEDDDDDDDGNFDDAGSLRALSVSTPDLHRDDDDFNQIENITRSPMRSTTKEIRRPEKLHKIIKSTSPSRGKESKSGRSSKTEGGYSSQKGDPVRYIRVGRDIKHTERKVPSSPSTSRHAKRSPSGSRSPTTKARGLSKDRHRQSRSKSPKRADSRTRTPQVVRSLSASNETLKTKKLKDRRTKSMEKTSRRTRDPDQARTGKPSPLSPRAVAKRSESRRAHRDREYQDSDDSDINEPHTLFMELSKVVSPYSSSAAHQEPQNELALNKYNLLKRSSSNLLQLVKDSETEAFPMADAGKMQSLGVAKDTHQRSVSPRGRSSHSGKEEARHHRSRHSESREKSSGGGGGRSMEPRSSSRRANNSEEPLSPTIPDGSVFYDDDDNVSPVSPTFPSTSSQKYTRTFSPTRHTLRDWKRTGSRADDDDENNDDVCIDIETSDLESDPTAGKPYTSERSPLRSHRHEVPSGHSSSVSARYGSRSPEKTVQSPTIKVSKPDFDNTSPGHKASPSPTKSRDTIHPSSKSNTASFIPSPSVKSSHTTSIPTVGVPTEISKDPLSRSGSAKSNTPGSAIDPTRLTISIPQRFSTDDDESVSPMSLNSHSRSLSSKSPSKSPALSPVSASQKSSSVSTDGSSTAALSQPSTSRSPSPNTASNVFNEPHPHTGVSGGTTWFDKIQEMKIGSRRAAVAGGNEGNRMFFPEIDVKRPRAVEALQREAADAKGKKKNVKVQRSFSERDASKRPAPRIPEIMVKTDSMQKITRISAENIRRFGEMDTGNNTERMLRRGGHSSSEFMGMRRKGDKLTSSESALEKAGEKQSLLEVKKEMEESKKEKSKTKRWSLKGKSKDKAMEKKKELEKKKSKKEKKSSKKDKKSDGVNSNKDDQGGPHASTQTVLLGEHLAGIKLDVEANYDEDGGEDGVRKTDKGGGGLSLSAVVLLKNRLARQRRLRIGFDLENDDMDSVTEFRELNLLNQLVRQPLDAPLSLENETNLFKPLDIRETALVDDDPTQTGGMYEKIDTTKQLKEDDPNYQAKRAEMRRESKAFRMRERRRKILSCIKKFIAFLFSHIGLCSLVVAYSIMGGFVFKAIEGPFEEDFRIMNITKIRKEAVSDINKLSNDFKQGRSSSKRFMIELDMKLKEFQLTVHNATKNEVYTEDADERDLKWSYASSLLYAITVMTTIGYGHVAPKTPYGRIVTIFYAVLGIPLTLLCLTNIGNLMADGFRILYGKICCGLCCLLFKPRRYGRRKRRHFHDPEFCNCEVTERKVEKSNEIVQVPTSLCILLIAAYIFAGALLFSLWEKWDYLTGSYFCFITLSTIGFGDIVPGTDIKSWSQQEKLVLCALYLVIGLSLIAMCFNLVQEDVKAKCRWLGRKFGIIDKDDTSIN